MHSPSSLISGTFPCLYYCTVGLGQLYRQTATAVYIQQTEQFYRQGKPRNWRRGGRGCLCFYKNISSLDETYSSPHGRKSLIFLVTLSPLMNNQLSQFATAPYIYSYHASPPPHPSPPTPPAIQCLKWTISMRKRRGRGENLALFMIILFKMWKFYLIMLTL